MGPSGCGKTTLLNILMGFIAQDSGSIEGLPKLKSAVFQEDRLCEGFNALTNIRIVTGRRLPDEVIKEHLSRLGLAESMNLPVSQLSGGMKRRAALARAILADGEIIFLDEPFKGLDAATKYKTIEYLKENVKKKTLITVTHDEEETKLLGSRIIKMHRS
jgi:NitT/TauT family transport system ATP-binding protein